MDANSNNTSTENNIEKLDAQNIDTPNKESQKLDGNKVSFKLNEFEGPLDLLLFLIKKAEVNIYDIPISQITEQYLEYLKYMAKIDLENITDFYVLASTLLLIKSKMLLPLESDFDEDFDDPRQNLVEKLIEYQKFKKLSELIEEKEKESEWCIERKKQQVILPFEEEEIWEQAQIWDLLKIFSSIVNSINTERIIDLYGEVTVNEKITLIHELLEEKDDFLFTQLIQHRNSLSDVICSFLAILEMVKARYIMVYQNLLFGDIKITKREDKSRELSENPEGFVNSKSAESSEATEKKSDPDKTKDPEVGDDKDNLNPEAPLEKTLNEPAENGFHQKDFKEKNKPAIYIKNDDDIQKENSIHDDVNLGGDNPEKDSPEDLNEKEEDVDESRE